MSSVMGQFGKMEAALSFPRNAAVVALAIVLTAGVHAQQGPTPVDIVKAIGELGDDSFVVREQASQRLWSAGRVAEAALQAALKSTDPEVVRRARVILDRFEYGIYPDTPKNIVELAQQFRAGNWDTEAYKDVAPGVVPGSRLATVKKLLALDAAGYAVVGKIAAAEKTPIFRNIIYDMLREARPRIAAALLTRGDMDAVEHFLAPAVHDRATGSSVGIHASAIGDYAAILLLRGTLDKKITQLAAQAGPAREPRTAEILAYLHRAKGDLPSAFRAAEQCGDRALQRWLLWEQSKWGELLDRHPPRTDMKERHETEILGHQAAYQRLAGRSNDFEKTLAEIRRYADAHKGDPNEASISANVLLLNDRPQDAIDVCIQAKAYGAAFADLKSQMRYREAFPLADKVKGVAHKEAFLLETRRACTLYEMGEAEMVLPLLARLRDGIKDSTEDDWVFGLLVGSESRLGLKDLAFEHAALILARPKFSHPSNLFYQLLGDKSSGADMWWTFLRKKFPAEDHRATMKRLRSIVEGTLDRKELFTLAEAAAGGVLGPRELEKQQREGWLGVLGEAFLAAGLDKDAQRYFEDAIEVAGGRAPLLRLADFLAEKKQWQRAAALYGQAWEKDKQEAPVPLFLQGWALVQAGQKPQGEKLMKLAHWLPLANVEARYLLAEALAKRGLDEWARREWELTARIGDMGDFYTGDAHRNLSFAAAASGRFLEAAAHRELSMLRCLNRSTSFLESSAYLYVPHQIHQLRARGLLAAGKIDEALQEIRICLSFFPADVETPMRMAPMLEKNGRKKDADELFAKVFIHREQLCADYPRWAQQHNDLAWLGARCRRQLDKALLHARKAVELTPKSAAYLDTLAEVHFQLGDQAKAVELTERCLELDPRRDFYRRQLKRFEIGDRFAEVPRE